MGFAISAFAQEKSGLPGGATSLQESYQDWNLICQTSGSTVACAVSQQQTQQNGQRVMAVELRRNSDATLAGNLVLPFGLQLDAGATLQIDDSQPLEALRFSTCLPAGCIAPLTLDEGTVAALRAGSVLKIKVRSTDQKDVVLSVPLKGLAPALDRLGVLAGF
ncbi:invasion associated locus B family protein [Mesorhizobium sp. M7A.F.Ca.US.002.01.1.1]|nr:invasion associated locus B family protein [Mesorhizobium sp. M7A.F.Ca.US.002.01.1.1]